MTRIKDRIIAMLAALLVIGAASTILVQAPLAPRNVSAAPTLYSEDAVVALYETASPAVVQVQVTQQQMGLFSVRDRRPRLRLPGGRPGTHPDE
jgi:hypothetical protein